MKKNVRFFTTLLVAAICWTGLSSCGGGEDEPKNPGNNTPSNPEYQGASIIGQWQGVVETEYDDGYLSEESAKHIRINFKANGTLVASFKYGPDEYGEWHLASSGELTLYFTESDGDIDVDKYILKSLTATEAIATDRSDRDEKLVLRRVSESGGYMPLTAMQQKCVGKWQGVRATDVDNYGHTQEKDIRDWFFTFNSDGTMIAVFGIRGEQRGEWYLSSENVLYCLYPESTGHIDVESMKIENFSDTDVTLVSSNDPDERMIFQKIN